jgi:hypothetical protein
MGFALVLCGAFGCGHEPQSDPEELASEAAVPPTDRPLPATLPAPRPEWIEYSSRERKLTMYDLRASGRWMIKRPDREKPLPMGPEYVLPEGLDAGETFVFYTRPGGQISRSVTVAQIQASRPEHVSINR